LPHPFCSMEEFTWIIILKYDKYLCK
jgi:hypothetical protein